MHPEAWDFIVQKLDGNEAKHVVEFGSRNVNGYPMRDLCPKAERYLGIDVLPGEGVDIVMDAASWLPMAGSWDLVICAEVFEHSPVWPAMVGVAAQALCTGGFFLVTCAMDPRAPHSGIDGFDVREGEWYQNVSPGLMADALQRCDFAAEMKRHVRGDLYVYARKL